MCAYLVLAALGMGALQGCAGSRQAAVWSSVRVLVHPNAVLDATPLREDYRYLRVSIEGRRDAMLMVLGYYDKDAQGRPVEVWYSGQGDVLRLQAGRLLGLSGGDQVQWLNVRLPDDMPGWSALPDGYRFERRRDEMPGYHWQRVDHLTVRRIAPVSDHALEGLDARQLQWFEESLAEPAKDALPPSRYALAPGASVPVYGEQCLSQTFCLRWQTWPPQAVATTPAAKP